MIRFALACLFACGLASAQSVTWSPVPANFPLTIVSPTNGQCLTYNGTTWVNSACGTASSVPASGVTAGTLGSGVLLSTLGQLPAQSPGTTLSTSINGGTVSPSAHSCAQQNVIQGSLAFSPICFGAVGSGSSTTAATALGISTLAGLTRYTRPVDGTNPYSWAGTYPHGNLFNLPVSAISSAAASTLTFQVQHTVGLTLYTTNTVSSGSVLNFTGMYGVYPGLAVSGSACLPATPTVSSIFATAVILSGTITCSIASGTAITFATPSVPTPLQTENLSGQSTSTIIGSTAMQVLATPAQGLATLPTNSLIFGSNIGANGLAACSTNLTSAGSITLCSNATLAVTSFNSVGLYAGWSLYLTDVTGVYQGMTVSGLSNASGTVYVEYVNPSTNEVRLSKAVGGQAGNTLTFSWPQISTITSGMQVQIPGTSALKTVSSVNTSTGVVTLSSGITAQVNPANSNFDSPHVLRGTPITFWSQFTDSQAANLQMDALGIQAAEQAAETAGGGLVQVPAGIYLIDQTIVFPVYQLFGSISPVVSLQGAGEQSVQTVLQASYDLGKDHFILSCGDPTGQPENGNGIYGGSGAGAYCTGHWRDIQVTTSGYSASAIGVRPTISSVPVAMSGIRSGPRRELDNIVVQGFNDCINWNGDHTRWTFVTLRSCFIGHHMSPPLTTLYGDNDFEHVFFTANTFAGEAISSGTYWNGVRVKPYIGFNPYATYCEPGGTSIQQCMANSEIIQANEESEGCGMIIDGNIQPTANGYGATATLLETHFNNLFASAGQASFMLNGGCNWVGYVDVYGLYGVQFTRLPFNTFPNVTGGQTLGNTVAIIRGQRMSNFSDNNGGVLLSGGGMGAILANYGSSCQEIVTGAGDSGSTFYFTGGDREVRIEQPGTFSAKEAFLVDSGATTISQGEIFEAVTNGTRLVAQRGGTATAGSAYIQGTSMQAYGCNMNNRFIVVGTSGKELPVAVPASEAVGTLLKMFNTTVGTSAVASSVTDGQGLGVVSDSNGGSTTLEYMQAVFPTSQF